MNLMLYSRRRFIVIAEDSVNEVVFSSLSPKAIIHAFFTSGFLAVQKKKMKNPWSELNIVKRYWKKSRASPTAMTPKIHVNPRRELAANAIFACCWISLPWPTALALVLINDLMTIMMMAKLPIKIKPTGSKTPKQKE